MPKLSPEGSRPLDNVMAAMPAAPPPQAQARHPEERANMPSGDNTKPTRAPLQDRRASPASGNTSGLERAMGAAADKLHPTKRR